MKNVRDVPYILGIDEKPLRSLLNANVEIEHITDQYSVMTISNPAKDYDRTVDRQPPFHIDYQVIYGGNRYMMTSVDTSGSANTVKATADIAYLKLGKTDTTFELVDQSVTAIADKILEGTIWTADYIEKPDELHSVISEGENKLHMLRVLAELSGLKLTFDTINYTISLVDPETHRRSFVAQEGVNVKDLERSVHDIQATELYPIGIDDVTIGEVNGGKDYLENYNYYLQKGWSLDEARKRFRRVEYRKYDNLGFPDQLLEAGQKDLPHMAFPRVSYSVNLDILPKDVKPGDYFHVIDSLIDEKIFVQVVRMVEYSDQSRNIVELNYLTPGLSLSSLSSGADFNSDGGRGTGGVGNGIKRDVITGDGSGTGTGGDGTGGDGTGGDPGTGCHYDGITNGLSFTGGGQELYVQPEFRKLGDHDFVFTPKYTSIANVAATFFVQLDQVPPSGYNLRLNTILRLNSLTDEGVQHIRILNRNTLPLLDANQSIGTTQPHTIDISAMLLVTPRTTYGISVWVGYTLELQDGATEEEYPPRWLIKTISNSYTPEGITASTFNVTVGSECETGVVGDLQPDDGPTNYVGIELG